MKKWTKGLLAVAFAGAFVLTGCSSIDQVENNKTEILYNGGSIVAVGDYLYYGNGYASGVSDYSTSSDGEYKTAQEYSYLARTNLNGRSDSQYKNENNVDKLNDRIAGYSSSYMFVLGNNIYFATPNLHKTNENKYVWNYVSFFKMGINGGKAQELYTTETYDESTAQVRALSYNGKHYIIIFDGTNLVKISLENDSVQKLTSTAVTSVALPDEGEKWNGTIYYTTANNSEVGQKGNIVCRVNIENDKSEEICKEINLTITFTGRVKNKVFFSRKTEGSDFTETYVFDADNANGRTFNTASKKFYNLVINNINEVSEDNTLYNGYTFEVTVNSKTQVMYYNQMKNETSIFLAGETGFANTVASCGTYFYYMTSDKIMRKTFDTNEETTIVSDMTIKNDGFGYDYYCVDGAISNLNSIYFYAQVPVNESDESSGEEKDSNYYLFRVDANGAKKPSLIGKK